MTLLSVYWTLNADVARERTSERLASLQERRGAEPGGAYPQEWYKSMEMLHHERIGAHEKFFLGVGTLVWTFGDLIRFVRF